MFLFVVIAIWLIGMIALVCHMVMKNILKIILLRNFNKI